MKMMDHHRLVQWGFIGTTAIVAARVPVGVAEDFNIEIDFMVESGSGGHSHEPTPEEVNMVIQMFACQGHWLTVQIDDAITHHDVLARDPNFASNFFGYSGADNSFGRIKDDFFDHAGEGGWHYCIFAHQYEDEAHNPSGSSGLAELFGDDFVVTLGAFDDEVGTPFDRAATLAHEFGHNLGLTHCGSMDCGQVGNRPLNVASVMSYFYQLAGVRSHINCRGLSLDAASLFNEIDYSHGSLCSLNEASLDEGLGTGMIGVDWNCDGSIGGAVSQDLDAWCGARGGALDVLSDYDEWANIHDFTRTRSSAELEHLPMVACITAEDWAFVREVRGGCTQPPIVLESCIDAKALFVDPAGSPSASGACSDPFGLPSQAHAGAPDGSVIYLVPGTHNEPSAVIFDRSVVFRSTGSATIR